MVDQQMQNGDSDSESSESSSEDYEIDLDKVAVPQREDLVASMPPLTLLIEQLRNVVTEGSGPDAEIAWLAFIREYLNSADDEPGARPLETKLAMLESRQVDKDRTILFRRTR
jgi:hypothetical protein